MNQIEKLIEELCPDGVEYKPLGELGTFSRGGGLQKKDFTESGVGCIHYGQIYTHYGIWATETKSFVSDDFAAKKRKMLPGDVFIATTSENDEDLGKATAWLGTEEIVTSGDGYIFRHSMNPKFVSYFFNSSLFHRSIERWITGTKVRRISSAAMSKVMTPCPPIEIQQEIVKILDTFQALEAELEAELEARKKQYEFYRNQLLTFTERERVQRTTLGAVFEMKAGKAIRRDEISPVRTASHPFPAFGGNGVRGYVREASNPERAVLIGRQGALCGNVNWAPEDFYATEHAIVMNAHDSVNTRWAYHMLKFLDLNQYATKSAQPGLSVQRLKSVPIPIPPLEEQQRIVNILDKFDALVNDLTSGLPAEIEARRKQYEFYRDQLLTFKELSA